MVAVNLKTANVVRALDSNGAAVSGAKLYVFERGTTTEVTTYSDLALTSANAHPVVADSSGSWGDIYLTGGVYKIDVTTSGGTSLPGYPVDDVSVVSQSGLPEGTTRPSKVKAGERWLDVTGEAVPIVKWYDGTDDITTYTLNYNDNTVSWPATSVSIADGGGFYAGSNVETVLADIGANYLKAGRAFTGELQLDCVVQTPADVFTSSSNAVALVMTGGSKKTLTLDENTTITVSGEIADQVVELWIKQGSTGGTAAWSGVDQWIGGSAPTLSTTEGQRDFIILTSDSDGTTIIGHHIGVSS